jgi:hypothetical protein
MKCREGKEADNLLFIFATLLREKSFYKRENLLLVRLFGKGHSNTIQISLTILGNLTATTKYTCD